MEHTHLVKGLDYALLEKVCALFIMSEILSYVQWGLLFSVLSYSTESGPVSCTRHDFGSQESFVVHKNICGSVVYKA